MAFTIHGHHIPGTEKPGIEGLPENIARCGGVTLCKVCWNEAKGYLGLAEACNPTLDFDLDMPDTDKELVLSYNIHINSANKKTRDAIDALLLNAMHNGELEGFGITHS